MATHRGRADRAQSVSNVLVMPCKGAAPQHTKQYGRPDLPPICGHSLEAAAERTVGATSVLVTNAMPCLSPSHSQGLTNSSSHLL